MSLVRAGAGSLGTRWRGDDVALGAAFHRHLAIDRNWTVAFPKNLAGSLLLYCTLGWAAVTLAPLAVFHGTSATLAVFLHTMVAEYMSFILLLFALYTVAGGFLLPAASARTRE